MASDIKYEGMDVHRSPKKAGIFVKKAVNGVFLVYSVNDKLEKTWVSEFTQADLIDSKVKGCKAKKFKEIVKQLFAKIRVTDICITPEVRNALK